MMLRDLLALVLLAVAAVGPAHATELIPRRDGESEQILERLRLYRESHGVNGELDSARLLERAHWGYERWLAAEHRRTMATTTGAGWVSLGPSNGAGRMTAVAPHPTEAGTLLAGAASGGLWKTTDAGASWRPLTDGLTDLSVGAVAYAPSDPDVVYLGTGEGGLGSFFVPGIGLLRSPDGGETWHLPLPGEIVAEQFYALSVDPRNPDRLLAATERGLFATADGGATWQLRLSDPGLYGVTEVVRATTDPDRVWVALWCFSSCPAGLARVMTSADGGQSFIPAAGGLPDALFNNPNANRIALAPAPSDDRVLYVALNTDRFTPQGPDVAIYRSADGGASWARTADPGPYLLGQGWYDNALTVDPSDPDTVIGAGVWYVRSTDGGASWTTLDPIAAGDWMGTQTLPHVDGHAFAWQDGTLWLGCDGGMWASADAGATWSGRNETLVTRQFYGLDIDPIRPDRVLGGTQDNKTNLRWGPGDDDWAWVLDGDGFAAAINPLVPDLVYGTIYGTLIFRSVDGGATFDDISPATGNDRNPFATPLTMHPQRPWELYTGSSRVWRSTDAGSSWAALGTEVDGGEWSTQVIRSVSVTPASGQRVLIGKSAEILTSRDGGETWLATTTPTIVNSVALSPLDPGLALAGLARTPAGEAALLRSTDGGSAWHPAADGLPPFAVQVVRWHPLEAATAFAGTDVGLYRSTDGGVTWSAVGDGLPAASVHDVRIAADGSRAVVATHGRGIWQLTLSDPAGEPPTVELDGPDRAVIGDEVVFVAAAVDPEGTTTRLRFLSSDDWRLIDAGQGPGAVGGELARTFTAAGEILVAANAVDADGRTGFDSKVVTAFEPGDDCATPRVIPGDGPFPVTILTENRSAGIGPEDPIVPCTTWTGDPDAGRWASIWLELTPSTGGTYIVTTCGSNPDTALSAWRGPACGPYQPIAGACNDDDRLAHCSGRDIDSWLSLELDADDTVRLLVGTTGDKELGDLRITVDCPTCRPPPATAEKLLAAAARTSGAGGTFWTSAVDLVNPGFEPVTTDVRLLPGPATGSAGRTWDIAAGSAIAIDDVVGELLGDTGAGAVVISSSAPLAVASRTATDGDDGSYGQGIAAVPVTAAAADGEAVRLVGLNRDPAFRTNLGLVNPGPDPVALDIGFYNDQADRLAERTETLAPGTWRQLNRVLAGAEVAGEAVLAVIRQTSAAGRFTAYASSVDERTGDPTLIAPSGIGRPDDPLWIPAAAHIDGVGGIDWRTDLAMFNPGTGNLVVSIELVGADGVVGTARVGMPEGWTLIYPDVVADRLQSDGAGAIRITPDLGLVMATTRTYVDDPAGTHGQGIPGVSESTAVAFGELAVLPGVRQNAQFRTNVGLVNTGDSPLDLVVRAHAADGAVLANLDYSLPALGWHQANQPLPAGTAYATVTSPIPGAAFLAYASVVDRRTDDPTYIAAVRAEE